MITDEKIIKLVEEWKKIEIYDREKETKAWSD